jgi:phytoene synthase
MKGTTLARPCPGWATPEDLEACRQLHLRAGGTYALTARFFPSDIRGRIHALHGFVKLPKQWVDHATPLKADSAGKLADYRRETLEGFRGTAPTEPILRAFLDTAIGAGVTLTEPMLYLDACESDLTTSRYPTYPDLERYMRGSAGSVALMMCDVLGITRSGNITEGALALAEAVQLTLILRDVASDLDRGRIYLPLEDLDRFGVTEEDMINRRVTGDFIALMEFESKRARKLFEVAEGSISYLPKAYQRPVRLSSMLCSRILERIQLNGFDVFHRRPRMSAGDKFGATLKVMVSGQKK